MPCAFRVSSRFVPMNLSGPFVRAHSPFFGAKLGSIIAAGVMSAPPTRLYHTIAPAARAASCSRLTLGTVATQRGRAPQFCFIMSMMSRAVVEWSSVTALSSGFGGRLTVPQSSRMSPAKADAANAMISAVAAKVAPRNTLRISNIVSSLTAPRLLCGPRLPPRPATKSLAAASARRRRIHRQRNVVAKRRLQPLNRAILIAAARAASHAYRPDHLPVHHDRDAARIREEIKVCGLPRGARRIVLELRARNGGRRARLQRGLRLQQSGTDVVIHLPIHALHVHEFTGIVEDVD